MQREKNWGKKRVTKITLHHKIQLNDKNDKGDWYVFIFCLLHLMTGFWESWQSIGINY